MGDWVDKYGATELLRILRNNVMNGSVPAVSGIVQLSQGDIVQSSAPVTSKTGGSVYYNRTFDTFVLKYNGVYYNNWPESDALRYGNQTFVLGRYPYVGKIYSIGLNLYIYDQLQGFQKIDLKLVENLAARVLTAEKTILDGIMVAYKTNLANSIRLVSPERWQTDASEGEVALGVVLFSGTHRITIAPTETSLPWSANSTFVASGAYSVSYNRNSAANDFAGKTNTAAIVSTEANPTSNSCAATYCSTFVRQNNHVPPDVGQISAGSWWLPSVGEMLLIASNKEKINRVLEMIPGSQQLSDSSYWTSTEYSATDGWMFNLGTGTFDGSPKQKSLKVRPVTDNLS